MTSSVRTAQEEQTKRELDQLALAIVGNSETYSYGTRADFGYVGDVGALPPNLDALTTNPGSYSTWDGPYIEPGLSGTDFKIDGWGVGYTLTATIVRSTGSGSNIDKMFAPSSASLLSNSITGVIVDASRNLPGAIYKDSLRVVLTYPNGTGGTMTSTATPNARGEFSFANLPIGNRQLRVIYTPASDTISYAVAIYPGRTTKLDIAFPHDLF